jgi:hypothetical protein
MMNLAPSCVFDRLAKRLAAQRPAPAMVSEPAILVSCMAGRLAWVDAGCGDSAQCWLWSSSREPAYNSVVVMTKRSKKRGGKKSSEAPQCEGGGTSETPETIAERPGQSVGGPRQGLAGPAVDISFFRSSAQLYGELHQRLSRTRAEGFTEAGVSQIGRQVFQALDELAEAVDPRSESRNACPFVMLLSMLLPTLRKFLAWTQATRAVWGSNFAALRHQSTSSDGSLYRGEADTVLWAMVAQQEVLSRVSLQAAHILRHIESSDGVEHEGTHPKRTAHHSKAPKPTSQASSASSSCSSAASTPRDPLDAAIARTPRAGRDQQQHPVPQIHHITTELAHVDAECKVHLADLTENLVEVVDMVGATVHSAPVVARAHSSCCTDCQAHVHTHRQQGCRPLSDFCRTWLRMFVQVHMSSKSLVLVFVDFYFFAEGVCGAPCTATTGAHGAAHASRPFSLLHQSVPKTSGAVHHRHDRVRFVAVHLLGALSSDVLALVCARVLLQQLRSKQRETERAPSGPF